MIDQTWFKSHYKQKKAFIFWWTEWFWYCLHICCIWSMWESLFYDSVFHLSSDRSSLMNMCAPIFTKIVIPLSKKNISHIAHTKILLSIRHQNVLSMIDQTWFKLSGEVTLKAKQILYFLMNAFDMFFHPPSECSFYDWSNLI